MLQFDERPQYSIKYVGVSGGEVDGEMGILSRRVNMPRWGEHLLHDHNIPVGPAGVKYDPSHPKVRERRSKAMNQQQRPTTASTSELLNEVCHPCFLLLAH